MIEQRFPKGWDEQRVRRLLTELDVRSEDDDQAIVTVPTALLPEIRRLLAGHKTA